MNSSEHHPLARKVRIRKQCVRTQAEVLSEVDELLVYLDENLDTQLDRETDSIHKYVLKCLVRSYLRLGVDAKAIRLAKRLSKTKHGLPFHQLFVDEKVMLGDWQGALEALDDPPVDPKRSDATKKRWEGAGYFSGARAAQMAVWIGDVDQASAMLDDAAQFQISNPEFFTSLISSDSFLDSANQRGILRANGELAALAHVMGREELVLPALFRARYLIEGGADVSDRPLLESPSWIEKGKSMAFFLLNAIAASGKSEIVLQLIKGRDLMVLLEDMNEVWNGFYSTESLYVSIAQGGCPREALESARSDPKNPLGRESKPYAKYQYLNWIIPGFFRCGEVEIGKALADECLEAIELSVRQSKHPGTEFGSAEFFAKQLKEVGQDAIAEKVAKRMFALAWERGPAFLAALKKLIPLLPEEERGQVVERLTAESSTGNVVIESTLSMLGIAPPNGVTEKPGGPSRFGFACHGSHDALRAAGNRQAARELYESFVVHALDPKCDNRTVKIALSLCAEYDEMDRAEAIINKLLKPLSWTDEVRSIAKHYAGQNNVNIEKSFRWARGLADQDLRFAACCGVLSSASCQLVLVDSPYKTSRFSNLRVLAALGLSAHLTAGVSFGC